VMPIPLAIAAADSITSPKFAIWSKVSAASVGVATISR